MPARVPRHLRRVGAESNRRRRSEVKGPRAWKRLLVLATSQAWAGTRIRRKMLSLEAKSLAAGEAGYSCSKYHQGPTCSPCFRSARPPEPAPLLGGSILPPGLLPITPAQVLRFTLIGPALVTCPPLSQPLWQGKWSPRIG